MATNGSGIDLARWRAACARIRANHPELADGPVPLAGARELPASPLTHRATCALLASVITGFAAGSREGDPDGSAGS